MRRFDNFLKNQKYLLILAVLLAVLASLQSYVGELKSFVEGGELYTGYNNYLIFQQSFFHLIEQRDLYILYEQEHWDLFKYSPSFALLFGGLAYFPPLLGLTIWNLLNSLTLFFALYFLPGFDTRRKGLIFLFVLVELLTSLQNEQSNGLMTGLLVCAFGLLEKRWYWLASLCLVSSIFIKLFGVVGLALYVFYPDKIKLTYTTAFWVVAFTLLPLLVVDVSQLVFLYQSWANLLANDRSISDGLSVIGWLKTWFGWSPEKMLINLAGVVIFCLPLLRLNQYGDFRFRALLLASILVWVVIFNHRAESPTFVTAVTGVALWYFVQAPKTENLVLLLLTFVFTILSATDLFPAFVRKQWFVPYVVKAVPCILVWAKITFDLLFQKYLPIQPSERTPARDPAFTERR